MRALLLLVPLLLLCVCAQLTEFPRPSLQRLPLDTTTWRSLNGQWQILPDATKDNLESPPDISQWASTKSIAVPWPAESPLGLNRTLGNEGVVFYRLYTDQRILPPRSPSCTRMLLHLEASDYETHVWVNGYKQHPLFPINSRYAHNSSNSAQSTYADYHRGGFNRITFDVTSSITGPCYDEVSCPPGHIEIIVGVFDPTDNPDLGIGLNPLGKQTSAPQVASANGKYSSVSGLWGSVWLEGVPQTMVTSTLVTPHSKSTDDGSSISAVVVKVGAYVAATPDIVEGVSKGRGGATFNFTAEIGAGGTKVAVGSGVITCAPAPPAASPATRVRMGMGLEPIGQDCSGEAAIDLASLAGMAGMADAASRSGAGVRAGGSDGGFRLWSPDDPFLYNITVTLYSTSTVDAFAQEQEQEQEQADQVLSYFGLRTLSTAVPAAADRQGSTLPHLNGQPLFVLGVVDDGYYPGGLYTPQRDSDLHRDLALAKALGFNAVRKRMKVEPERWYYHADRLGLLVLQDMPALDSKLVDAAPISSSGKGSNSSSGGRGRGAVRAFSPSILSQYRDELARMVDRLSGHPSVAQWVLFSEAWGEPVTSTITDVDRTTAATAATAAATAATATAATTAATAAGKGAFARAMLALVEGMDGTRWTDAASGWDDYGGGNVSDFHDYGNKPSNSLLPGNHTAVGEGRFYQLGECGGYNSGSDSGGQTQFSNVVASYERLAADLRAQRQEFGLGAAVYTKLADVGLESSGLVQFSRAFKGGEAGNLTRLPQLYRRIAAANQMLRSSLRDTSTLTKEVH